LQFRSAPPGTGGTYQSARLPVRGSSATGRYRQKSIVDDRLREKKGRRRRRRKEEKRREKGKKEIHSAIHARRSPVCCRRPYAIAVLTRGSPACCRRSRALAALARFFSHARRRHVSPRGEKDRATIAEVGLPWCHRSLALMKGLVMKGAEEVENAKANSKC
ncbi:hypothetical protein BHE74_00036380, partial [Ensete ventricosum]